MDQLIVYLCSAIGAIVCVELFIRFLPSSINGFFATLTRILYVIGSSKISDHWKEKILLVYAGRLMKSTLVLFVTLMICLLPFIVLLLVPHIDLKQFLYSWVGIFYTTLVALVYAFFRSMLKTDEQENKSDYNEMSQILHRIVLGNRIVPLVLFNIERIFFFRKRKYAVTKPVFVCGLARAGTTMLMREIYTTNKFSSLTYADMPFVTSPNLWRILSGGKRKKVIAKERSHGDGVMVTTDSPEALEEVFWKIFCGVDYLYSDKLIQHQVDRSILKIFKEYVALVSDKKQYLSKNNNNILRISSIKTIFPDAVILVPFRTPFSHAQSLLQQHQRFVHMSNDDPFVKEYMSFLAHHEFGATQKPFIFSGQLAYEDPNNINYWLSMWSSVYEYLYSNHSNKVVFVSYEELCDKQSKTWDKISMLLNQKLPSDESEFHLSLNQNEEEVDQALLSHAKVLYNKMLSNLDK